MSSANRSSFISSTPVCMLFFLLIAYHTTRTSRGKLNKSGESEHPGLVSELRGELCLSHYA
jgi:hypothetical protein